VRREEHLRRISGGRFQVLVIGGGITGAGIAWDCALRGLSVALLERTDFAAGTSSVSSKMVHAGLRYMVNEPELVREASLERRWLFGACPHLARPLEYWLPAYADSPEYDAAALPAVLARYDELAGRTNTRPGRLVDPEAALSALPGLRRGVLAVGSYWDGVMDDARVNLEVVLAAAAEGAAGLNHAPVTGFLRDGAGRVRGVRFRAQDPASGGEEHEVAADAVVSAAGVYTDLLLGLGEHRPPSLRPSKGIHLVFRSEATGGRALVVPVGGNVLYFLVPLRPGYLAMGCTDTDYPVNGYGDLDHVPSTEEEVRFTLGVFERVLPGAFRPERIAACYAGVRPLARPPASDGEVSESATSRTHRIWQEPGGIWAIAGGKYTTFRLMAEQLVDRLVEDLRGRGALAGAVGPCVTAGRRCHGAPDCGGEPEAIERWETGEAARLARRTGLPADCCRHLAAAYGTAAAEVAGRIEREPALGRRLAADRPYVAAELGHAVEREMCRGVADFLARRTQLRFLERQGLDAVETVAEGLGGLLGWSRESRRRQAEEYREHLRRVTPLELH